MIGIRVRMKGGLMEVFGDYRFICEINYFHLLIAEDRSEGIELAEHPTVQGTKRYEEGTKV